MKAVKTKNPADLFKKIYMANIILVGIPLAVFMWYTTQEAIKAQYTLLAFLPLIVGGWIFAPINLFLVTRYFIKHGRTASQAHRILGSVFIVTSILYLAVTLGSIVAANR